MPKGEHTVVLKNLDAGTYFIVDAIRIYDEELSPVSVTGVTLDKFSDRARISDWAMESVRWAVGEGIIAGRTDGTLDPQGYATRAEVAAMLMRFVKKLG